MLYQLVYQNVFLTVILKEVVYYTNSWSLCDCQEKNEQKNKIRKYCFNYLNCCHKTKLGVEVFLWYRALPAGMHNPEFRKYQSNKTKILAFERVKGLKERELDFSTGVNFNISK